MTTSHASGICIPPGFSSVFEYAESQNILQQVHELQNFCQVSCERWMSAFMSQTLNVIEPFLYGWVSIWTSNALEYTIQQQRSCTWLENFVIKTEWRRAQEVLRWDKLKKRQDFRGDFVDVQPKGGLVSDKPTKCKVHLQQTLGTVGKILCSSVAVFYHHILILYAFY